MQISHLRSPDIGASRADVVVVIDVLRAFTVAPWTYERGAERLLICASTEAALECKAEHQPAHALKDGTPHPDFEYSNSPAQISRASLAGLTIVQRTRNGTVGVMAALHRPHVFAASLVNARATALAVTALRPRTVDLVATDKGAGEEDLAAAAAIECYLEDGQPDESGWADQVSTSRTAERLRSAIRPDRIGVSEQDIAMACQLNRFNYALKAARLSSESSAVECATLTPYSATPG